MLPYKVCLCNDVLVGPDWLSNLLKPMKEDYKIEFVSSELLDIGHSHPFVNKANKFVKNSVFDNIAFDEIIKELNPLCKENTIQNVGGAYFPSFAMKRDTFNTVGPFDDKYEKTAYEDTDYVVRLHENFIKPLIVGNSIVYHFGGVTQHYLTVTDSNSFQQKNREYFMKKHNCTLDGYICSRSIFWDENGKVHPKLYTHNMGSKFHRMKE
jgi:GT2 family glycosyltransferase